MPFVPLVLSGSVEATVPTLAPWGFDCVETGETLRANNLREHVIVFDNLTLSLVSSASRVCPHDKGVIDTIRGVFGAV
jgi:ATP phosphoribosyltransferase